jgi:hypothetical protein
MSPRAHHRCSSWRPLALAATLALAPGCSQDPGPRDEFVLFRNSHGTLSGRYVPRRPPAAKAPPASPSPSLDDLLRQQWALAQAANQRRLDALAEQDMRRQRDEQWRREQQEIQAYNDWRWQTQRDRRLEEQARYRDYLQDSRQWFNNLKLRAQAEAAHWQRASQPIGASRLSQR